MVHFSASPKNEPHSPLCASETSAWLSNYQSLREMKRFEHWKYEEVELTFGAERVRSLPTLTEWL
ncbi:MAG: hypothetical protein U5L45_21455 [Saprospiraceae bacterium]|nr:hypothetical protein [Saprospiraceae bacterium]